MIYFFVDCKVEHRGKRSEIVDIVVQRNCHTEVVRRRRQIAQKRNSVIDIVIESGGLQMNIDIVPVDCITTLTLNKQTHKQTSLVNYQNRNVIYLSKFGSFLHDS